MRIYKSLAIILTSVLILAGCGGGGSSTSTATSTSTPPTPAPVTTVVTPVETVTPAETVTTAESDTAQPPQNILEAVSQSTMPVANAPENNPSTINLTGVAAKGVMQNANIVVFDPFTQTEELDDEGEGLLGHGVTNANGEFSISVETTETTGDFLAIAALFEGATMICDAPSGCIGGAAFGEPVALSAEEGGIDALFAIFPKPAPGADAVANLNLFTHMQLLRMLGIALETPRETPEGEEPEPITLEAQHFEPAFNFIVNAFQLEHEPFHTVPFVDVTAPIGSTNQNAVNMALLSAGFLEAGTQSQIARNGEEVIFDDVFDLTIGITILPQIFTVSESDADNNPRLMSLEDIFEAALATAELNTAQNNATSLAIDLLNQQNAAIDALPFGARLESDGTYPDPSVVSVPDPQDLTPESNDPAPDPQPLTTTDTSGNEVCRPNLSPITTDEIVLLSGFEGTAYSSVAVSSLDRDTEVTRVSIEPGETPLYIIASTFEDMVWSIEGDTDRVAGFVAARGQRPGFAGVGVVGLPTEKVDFIDYSCMPFYSSTSTPAATMAQSRFEGIFGRSINHVVSTYTLSSVALPSGQMREPNEQRDIADNGITFNSQPDTAYQTQLLLFKQEGLATVPVNQVVSPGQVQTYDVLPAEAGLAQLLSSGHIEFQENASAGNFQDTYFIHETFPRFPAGLTGAQSVEFILGTGVALPGGDAGHSTIRIEETGECIGVLC